MKETGATERPKFAKAPPWINIEYGEEALLLLLADAIRVRHIVTQPTFLT